MTPDDPDRQLAALARQLQELHRIGAALAEERDLDRLLELILTKAREITSADAGSLYIVEAAGEEDDGAARLRFAIAQNDSIALPFGETTLEITDASLAGHVALRGLPVNLADAYAPPADAPYACNRAFDEASGYRTQSVLAVPMHTPKGHTVGVVQLINAKRDFSARLESPAVFAEQVVPFTPEQQALLTSLAAQAAVALENSQLYASIQRLFEGFVRASVVAIEARDPATSGHSFRVANLTIALAEAADRATTGPFASLSFTRDEMLTLRYASLLHDFGKVGVREDVLVKAKKLHPQELGAIRDRFGLARRSRQVRALERQLDYVVAHGLDAYLAKRASFDRDLERALAELEAHFAEIVAANEPTVLPADAFDRLRDIAAISYEDDRGAERPLLDADELRLLSLRQGSLSEAERLQIESHVVHTYRFLSQIPWTKEMRAVPRLALQHHEKLNGTGYPHSLSAQDIPVQARMMTIADIFDALAAADRPYKKAVPIEKALEILGASVAAGELDADLFRLFVDARVIDRWKTDHAAGFGLQWAAP